MRRANEEINSEKRLFSVFKNPLLSSLCKRKLRSIIYLEIEKHRPHAREDTLIRSSFSKSSPISFLSEETNYVGIRELPRFLRSPSPSNRHFLRAVFFSASFSFFFFDDDPCKNIRVVLQRGARHVECDSDGPLSNQMTSTRRACT